MLPSSPGACQLRSTVVAVGFWVARSSMSAGGSLSLLPIVKGPAELDTSDELASESITLSAK